jgi:hypothetical protein
MTVIKNILFLIIICISVSCISDEESQRQVNSDFQGEWVGTFSGNDSGTIVFTVQKEGTIVGDLTSLTSNTSQNFKGYVSSNGKFDINTRNNYYFSGYLDNIKPVKGQWTNVNTVAGNFQFHKK